MNIASPSRPSSARNWPWVDAISAAATTSDFNAGLRVSQFVIKGQLQLGQLDRNQRQGQAWVRPGLPRQFYQARLNHLRQALYPDATDGIAEKRAVARALLVEVHQLRRHHAGIDIAAHDDAKDAGRPRNGLAQQRILAGIVHVERRAADIRPPRNVLHADGFIAARQHLAHKGFHQGSLGARDPAVRLFLHGATLSRALLPAQSDSRHMASDVQ